MPKRAEKHFISDILHIITMPLSHHMTGHIPSGQHRQSEGVRFC